MGGSYGVVYECALSGTKNFHFAVKMVDKVETPLEEIKEEARIMKDLTHPNIVKFYEVYYEKCFVCLVMDKYTGGDLIEGMQAHWETRGQIPPMKSVHLLRGMMSAVHYLHAKMYVHRDIKADNYLLDR